MDRTNYTRSQALTRPLSWWALSLATSNRIELPLLLCICPLLYHIRTCQVTLAYINFDAFGRFLSVSVLPNWQEGASRLACIAAKSSAFRASLAWRVA